MLNEFYEEYHLNPRIEGLKKYYEKNKELTVIGLGELQDSSLPIFRREILDFLSDNLEGENTKTTVINAFSLMFNKTEHINYLLKSNPNLEEIKDLQVYGMVSALEKAFADFYAPSCLGKIGYLSKNLYRHDENDKNIKLTTTLKNAKQPIVVYSGGNAELMREGGVNPLKIARDRKKENDTYKYALNKLGNFSTIKKVVGKVEENFNNILSINDKADIFALGLYIPKSFQNEGMEVFENTIELYNEFLKTLCSKYNISYVDTKNIMLVNHYDHITTDANYALAVNIIELLYNKKIYNPKKTRFVDKKTNLELGKHGLYEMLVDLKKDLSVIQKERENIFSLDKRLYEINIERENELKKQIEVVEKTLLKRM